MGPMTGKMKFVTFRWTLFNCLLVGSLVWISYRAALTSELSVIKTKLPFTDLKSLAETDYRLLLPRKNTAVAHLVMYSKPGSLLKRVLDTNVDMEKSFTGPQAGLPMLMEKPRHAFMGLKARVLVIQKDDICQVCQLNNF
jgi:hypothetical protein